jgi:hypothetical protein
MNAIEMGYAIDFYTNLTHSSRFYNIEKNQAVQDAIMKKIDSIVDTNNPNPLIGTDRLQKFRDELYTLMKQGTLTVTNTGAYNDDVYINHANFPTDYQTYAGLTLTIGGNTTYARETMTYGNKGSILECSFRKPTNTKPYFLEDSTGLKIYKGDSTAISLAILDYIKVPATFNLGMESQYISAGAGVLTAAATYIAVEESVHNAITRLPGTSFVAVNTNLTSGQVVLASNTTPCELPAKCHEEIAKMAASILLGTTSAFDNSAYVEKESK